MLKSPCCYLAFDYDVAGVTLSEKNWNIESLLTIIMYVILDKETKKSDSL